MKRSMVIGAASTALVFMPGAVSQSASNSYVALGDSYSAGVGTKAKVDDCYRSQYGYPALVAKSKGLSLDYQACSGATTSDVQSKQLGALNGNTAYVTMTIGGNDLGFSDVLTTCAKPSWASDCNAAIEKGRGVLTGSLPGRYDSLFDAIRDKAPNAKVVIAGYPHIFQGEDCNALTFFSPDEESALNDSTDQLDELVLGKARDHSFGTVDPRSSFTGHAVCDSPEWINGLSNPVEESYHPNREGNAGYAALFEPAMTGSSMSPSVMREAARSQRLLPGPRTIPDYDITSKESLDGAKRVGISPDELRRLKRQLHSGDSKQVNAAIARLKALDRMAERKLAGPRRPVG